MTLQISSLSVFLLPLAVTSLLGFFAGCKLEKKASSESVLAKVIESDVVEQFSGKLFPEALLKELAKSETWISVLVSGDLGIPVSFSKKWKIKSENGVAVRLQEISKASMLYVVQFEREQQTMKWGSTAISLSRPLKVASFTNSWDGMMALPDGTVKESDDAEAAETYAFKKYGTGVIEVSWKTSAQQPYNVVFFPATVERSAATPGKGRSGFFPVPVPVPELAKNSIPPFLVEEPPILGFQHHDILGKQQTIIIDRKFPAQYRSVVQRAADIWNEGLGKVFFVVAEGDANIVIANCYTLDVLCLTWSGSESLNWFGPGGAASHAYDPESGLIRGGLIQLQPLQGMSENPNRKLEKGKHEEPKSIADAAKISGRMQDFGGLQHPKAEDAVLAVLLHEIGHFLGLSHNFYGSRFSTMDDPANTVMDYLAYPLRHRMTRLGSWDIALLRSVFSTDKMSENFVFCSDSDLLPMKSKDGRAEKVKANCLQNDFGPADQWLIELSKSSDDGVFGLAEKSSMASMVSYMPGYQGPTYSDNYLATMGFMLQEGSDSSARQKQNLKQFLCAQKQRMADIEQQLDSEQRVNLSCP